MSGFCRSTPSISVPPREENEAAVGSTPKVGVFRYNTAPTAIAPSALA